MKHILHNGKNNHVLVLLHGTGGDASSLFDLAEYMDPDAWRLGIQGDVVEAGMNRYFARNADGSFDLNSLAQATRDLHETLTGLLSANGLEDKRVILIGYSNGANIAQNLLKEYKTGYDLAILLHPSPVRPEVPFQPQEKLKVLITSGDNDPYITPEQFRDLEEALKQAGIPTESVTHDRGHSLTQGELYTARGMIAALDGE